jgi:hypothetical protein
MVNECGNFIDQTRTSSLNINSYLLSSPFPVQAMDSRPLGSGTVTHITPLFTLRVESIHQENIPLFITSPQDHLPHPLASTQQPYHLMVKNEN